MLVCALCVFSIDNYIHPSKCGWTRETWNSAWVCPSLCLLSVFTSRWKAPSSQAVLTSLGHQQPMSTATPDALLFSDVWGSSSLKSLYKVLLQAKLLQHSIIESYYHRMAQVGRNLKNIRLQPSRMGRMLDLHRRGAPALPSFGPPLDLLQWLHIRLVLSAPGLEAGISEGSLKGDNHLLLHLVWSFFFLRRNVFSVQ